MKEDKAPETPEAHAKRLIEEGYHQTSRKFRSVARIPPGMTAVEVCKMLAPQDEKIWREQYERNCADSVLGAVAHSYSFKDTCYVELDEATFAAFRKQGGGPF